MSKNDGLPEAGLVRLKHTVRPRGPLPIGRSTWWAGVKDGRYPKPVKPGSRLTAWRVDDIRLLLNEGWLDVPAVMHDASKPIGPFQSNTDTFESH